MKRHRGRALRRRYGRADAAKRYVVRRGGFGDNIFLDEHGEWGSYAAAKRFLSQDAADTFYRQFYSSENFGIFPVARGWRP